MAKPMAALVAALLLYATGSVAVAAPPVAAVLSAADRADVARVEQYFNSIKTLQAKFLQVAESGREASGTFYLSRPDKMRLEYDPPIKDFIVADGWFVFFWDDELKQQSSQPIGSSLADVILRENFHLSGDVTVTAVERSSGWLEVSMVETKDPGKGQMTLVFEDKPLTLRKWRVLDAQQLTTEVTLSRLQSGLPLDRQLFYFVPPEGAAHH
ncbi:MAG: outer membrane lipoprotein carrier protein LolA [Azospirillum sp.]|nr:outer membrane lipoprotein carrier protein LolA [Azospirillum sp.]